MTFTIMLNEEEDDEEEGEEEEVDASIVDPIAEKVHVVYTIVVIRFNDTFRAEYMKVSAGYDKRVFKDWH